MAGVIALVVCLVVAGVLFGFKRNDAKDSSAADASTASSPSQAAAASATGSQEESSPVVNKDPSEMNAKERAQYERTTPIQPTPGPESSTGPK